jgi:two-component system NtrC family sensor kinase
VIGTPLGIRAQLLWSVGAVSLLLAMGHAGLFWLVLKGTEEERRTEEALVAAALFAHGVAVGRGQPDPLQPLPGLRLPLADGVGQLWVEPAAPPAPASPPQVTGALWGDRVVEVQRPLGALSPGRLRVQIPLINPMLPVGPAPLALALTSLSTFFAGAAALAWLRSHLLRPLDALRGHTERIAAGEFGALLPVHGSREIVDLCGAFNTMSASLDAYRARTLAQVQALERANAELARAQDALVRSAQLAGVGRLAAGVAHELGNPLAAAIGYLELAKDGGAGADPSLVEGARGQLLRMDGIIRELLRSARPPATPAAPHPLGLLAAAAVDALRPLPAFRGVHLQVRCPEGEVWAEVSPPHLHQVLMNLLLNARDAVLGKVGAQIELHVRRAEGAAVLEVVDNGPGFPPALLPRLGEPFLTTKAPGEGNGLGLAACLHLMEGQGGSMQLCNLASGGACVRLRLNEVRPDPA